MKFIRVKNTICSSLGVGSIVALARDYNTLPIYPAVTEVKRIIREGGFRQPSTFSYGVLISDFIPYNTRITRTKELT